jgi:hypothetical protein
MVMVMVTTESNSDWAASGRFRDYRFRATIHAAQFAMARLSVLADMEKHLDRDVAAGEER